MPKTRKSPKNAQPTEEQTSYFVPNFIRNDSTRAGTSLLLSLGGFDTDQVAARLKRGEAFSVAGELTNAIQAAVRRSQQGQADPIPSHILAAMRVADLFYQTNGDVRQTVNIPAEVLLKSATVECGDTGAKKEWEHLWYDTLDIASLQSDLYYDCEILGQAFPLLIPKNGDLDGATILDPMSVWVGNSLFTQFPFQMNTDKELEKALAQAENSQPIYSCFVTDQNRRAVPAYRIPIKTEYFFPFFNIKRAYDRYAQPPIAAAARNIMYRQILEEYRRGTIEAFMSQLWVVTVGDRDYPATPNKIKRVREVLDNVAKQRTGVGVFDHTIKVEVHAPKTLDGLLGHEAYQETTSAIFRDLGFPVPLTSGESIGRGANAGYIETVTQFVIERWLARRERFVRWANQVSKFYATQIRKDNGLAGNLPTFRWEEIGIRQQEIIKAKVIPLWAAGLVDAQNALKDSGYDYEAVLANKKSEEGDAMLFAPHPSFAQTAFSPRGQTDSTFTPKGRPPGVSSPSQNENEVPVAGNVLQGQVSLLGQVAGQVEFQNEIDTRYSRVQSDDDVDEFKDWLAGALVAAMMRAYQNGFIQRGGLGDLGYGLLENKTQGIPFHLGKLGEFANDLKGADEVGRLKGRARALQYSGAIHTAFVLGQQAAMGTHGATHWRRRIHPELSVSGPCSRCQEDSLVVHGIQEPFGEFHPGGVCTAQSIMFGFGENGIPITIPIRDGLGAQSGRTRL